MSLHVMLVFEQEWVDLFCAEILSLSRVFWDTAEYVRDEVVSSPGFGAAYNELRWSLEWTVLAALLSFLFFSMSCACFADLGGLFLICGAMVPLRDSTSVDRSSLLPFAPRPFPVKNCGEIAHAVAYYQGANSADHSATIHSYVEERIRVPTRWISHGLQARAIVSNATCPWNRTWSWYKVWDHNDLWAATAPCQDSENVGTTNRNTIRGGHQDPTCPRFSFLAAGCWQ